MKVIGLTGFAKSGKSTAASILKELGGKEIAFAEFLKDVCAQVTKTPRQDYDDQSKKEVPFATPHTLTLQDLMLILKQYNLENYIDLLQDPKMLAHIGKVLLTPRHVAQYVGTDILRSIDENIHIKTAFNRVDPKTPFVFCSDVRFPNELSAVRDRGGIIIGISRRAVAPEDLSRVHASESLIPSLIENADFKAENESTIEAFRSLISKISSAYLHEEN